MWDVFISHASEDKHTIARPLADELTRRGYRVWYDEFALTLGDSLRRSIDNGLRESRFGVVVLSRRFFAKEWTQRELDGLTAREIHEGKVILPIWHEVTHADVARYSPVLADRVGVPTTKGINSVADAIESALRQQSPFTIQGTAVTPGEVRQYRSASSTRSRRSWRPLSTADYPALRDSENSRGSFISDVALSLIAVFQETGFRKFTALLHVESHVIENEHVYVYSLACHHSTLVEKVRRRGLDWVQLFQAAHGPDADEQRQRAKKAITEEVRAFDSRWKLTASVRFSEQLTPIDIEYDPEASKVTLKTLPLSLDPAEYRDRVGTTSEALQYLASIAGMRVASMGDLERYLANPPLLRLVTEVLDHHSFDWDRFRVGVEDLESWDYDNPDLDGRFAEFTL